MRWGRRQAGLSQARFPAVSAQIALSPNAVIVFNVPPFQADALVRSLLVTTTGAGMPGSRGQVFVYVHRFSATVYIGEDLRAYVQNFLSKPSRYFDVKSNENWQVVVYCGTQVPATGIAVVNADLEIGVQATDAPMLTLEDVGSGDGTVRSVALGDPGAGLNYGIYTVGANVQQRHKSFDGTLVVAGATAPRPLLSYDDGVTPYARAGGPAGGGIAGTYLYSGGLHEQVSPEPAINGTPGPANKFPLPDIGKMQPGHRIVFLTIGIAGGDNWGPGQILIEEWAGVP